VGVEGRLGFFDVAAEAVIGALVDHAIFVVRVAGDKGINQGLGSLQITNRKHDGDHSRLCFTSQLRIILGEFEYFFVVFEGKFVATGSRKELGRQGKRFDRGIEEDRLPVVAICRLEFVQ